MPEKSRIFGLNEWNRGKITADFRRSIRARARARARNRIKPDIANR